MKRTFIFTSYCLLFVIYYSFAQVPADSLPGTYAGQYWYANPSSNPWVITADTAYVTNIDSLNCVLQAYTSTFTITGTPPAATYYTDYYSCNSIAPINSYSKFYNIDSLRIIFDNIPQPFPNPPISMRFYGKRINNNTGLGINATNYKKPGLIAYPNPSGTVLFVEYKMFNRAISIQITDVAGQEIKSVQMNSAQMQIDISNIPNGTYFINVNTANGILTRKIVVQR